LFCLAGFNFANLRLFLYAQFVGQALPGPAEPHVNGCYRDFQSIRNLSRIVVQGIPQGQYFAVRWGEFFE
jgi:hypothetical protein